MHTLHTSHLYTVILKIDCLKENFSWNMKHVLKCRCARLYSDFYLCDENCTVLQNLHSTIV